MKINDPNASPELLAAVNANLASHLDTLRDIHLGIVDRATKYLLGTNGGGVIATLSFMGAIHDLRSNPIVWTTLSLYIFGVVVCGFLIAVDYQGAKKNLTQWVNDWNRFLSGDIDSQDIPRNLAKSSAKFEWISPTLGYLSFAAFIAGSAIALVCLRP